MSPVPFGGGAHQSTRIETNPATGYFPEHSCEPKEPAFQLSADVADEDRKGARGKWCQTLFPRVSKASVRDDFSAVAWFFATSCRWTGQPGARHHRLDTRRSARLGAPAGTCRWMVSGIGHGPRACLQAFREAGAVRIAVLDLGNPGRVPEERPAGPSRTGLPAIISQPQEVAKNLQTGQP